MGDLAVTPNIKWTRPAVEPHVAASEHQTADVNPPDRPQHDARTKNDPGTIISDRHATAAESTGIDHRTAKTASVKSSPILERSVRRQDSASRQTGSIRQSQSRIGLRGRLGGWTVRFTTAAKAVGKALLSFFDSVASLFENFFKDPFSNDRDEISRHDRSMNAILAAMYSKKPAGSG
jgi:hypothetical protein